MVTRYPGNFCEIIKLNQKYPASCVFTKKLEIPRKSFTMSPYLLCS